jgi:predicted permease
VSGRQPFIARRVFAIARFVALPQWLDDRVGQELQETFEERLAAATSPAGRFREVVRELAGLFRVAIAARIGRMHGSGAKRDPGGWSTTYDHFRQDLRFAWRSMRRNRVVSTLAIVTLAAGVGASTAMFSVIDTVLLRPLPFEHPEQIVFVTPTIVEWKESQSLHDAWQHGRFSAPEARAWIAGQRSFEAAGAYFLGTARVPHGAGSERVGTAAVSHGVWDALRVKPMLGRLPSLNEQDAIAVVTYTYWQSTLGGDSAAVGRALQLDGHPMQVVGVLPKSFEVVGMNADIWLQLPLNGQGLGNHSLLALGRLREGVTVAQAEDETTRLLRGVDAVEPKHVTHTAYVVSPVQEATESVRAPLLVLAISATVLLLAACANVALLLLGVGADRARELAVRQALGAHKRRIAEQLFVESGALSVIGAAVGLLVARVGVRLLIAITPAGTPRIEQAGVDTHTFAVATLLALATGALVGCAPAFSFSRVEAAESLRVGATTAGTGRLQRGIVMAELALATVLLIGAGLLTRTMTLLSRVNPGLDPGGVFTLRLALPGDRFHPPGVGADSTIVLLNTYIARIADALRTVPGVSDVARTTNMPFSQDRSTNSVEPEGYVPAPGELVDVGRRFVTPNYFAVMRIRAMQGRVLAPGDDQATSERVMVVTDEFARHFWPDGHWVGRMVGFRGAQYRVVGVIADTREHDLRGDADRYKLFAPSRPDADINGNFLLRTDASAAQLTPILRERLWKVDPAIVMVGAMPMRERMDRTLEDDRYRMLLMSVLSCVATLFSLLGIYGVISRSVARRGRELGLRAALGAPRTRLMSMVLVDAARVGAWGAVAGVGLALATTRLLGRLLWGVPPVDPITYSTVAGLLLCMTLVVAVVPARRAASIDVMGVLRR